LIREIITETEWKKLALKYKVSESHVAKKAVELARNAVENGNLTDKRFGPCRVLSCRKRYL